jgi:hypothetical protein
MRLHEVDISRRRARLGGLQNLIITAQVQLPADRSSRLTISADVANFAVGG